MRKTSTLLLLAAVALASPGVHAVCDDISGIPPRYDIVFETDIQPRIGGVPGSGITPFCQNCHVQSASGGLNMAPPNVRMSLLGMDENGQDSLNYPPWKRIVPGRPAASLVYQRIHCDDSPPGRMPPGASGATNPNFLLMQALVHDWIALGAIMADTDRRFVGDFETIR
jgi:hypothetical protein